MTGNRLLPKVDLARVDVKAVGRTCHAVSGGQSGSQCDRRSPQVKAGFCWQSAD